MRLPEAVRSSDENHSPVWQRTSKRRGGFPLFGLLITLLCLFAIVTIGLAVTKKSFAAAGEQLDAWTAVVVSPVKGLLPGKKDEAKAEEAAAVEEAAPIEAADQPAAEPAKK